MVTRQNLELFEESLEQLSPSVIAAIESLAVKSDAEARGAVFTRSEVVDFILDLVGYTEDKPLYLKRLLEPSFGAGVFLVPAIKRLLKTWRILNKDGGVVKDLGDAVRAVELHRETYANTRALIVNLLSEEGIFEQDALLLVDRWLIQGDFLLTSVGDDFDFVVGNPPYVRQEQIPAPLLSEYRARFHTVYDRADLYVPFIERSLMLLSAEGKLGFICADRWMKNRYGGPLRKLIADTFNLDIYVDMVDTPAFQNEVSAYPAITVIGRERRHITRVAHRPAIDRKTLGALSADLHRERISKNGGSVQEVPGIVNSDEPWILDVSDRMLLVRRLEKLFPTIEEASCKVGIGVATGADEVFIGDFATLDVEPDRKLPLVTTKDIQSGTVAWQGRGVINPFTDDGPLVDLERYPKLARYLEERRDVIARRHCAQKRPANWYRTIDRITPSLVSKPKLLIPDIKGAAHIVFERGEYYPHHNLYYIISKEWDLRALQAVLLSGIAAAFVGSYSTKMRGGYFRFQAQYLRRIRIPHWRDVPDGLRNKLTQAAEAKDYVACNRAVYSLYGLEKAEKLILQENGGANGS